MYTKAITVNLYTFHRNMSPIRGPFQGTDNTSSSHTERLRSGQTVCPPFPDPYLCPPQPMIPVCSCYSFSGTANFTLNNGTVVKHNRCCAVSDSLMSVPEWLAHHAGQKPFIVYIKRQVVVFHVPHLLIIKLPGSSWESVCELLNWIFCNSFIYFGVFMHLQAPVLSVSRCCLRREVGGISDDIFKSAHSLVQTSLCA